MELNRRVGTCAVSAASILLGAVGSFVFAAHKLTNNIVEAEGFRLTKGGQVRWEVLPNDTGGANMWFYVGGDRRLSVDVHELSVRIQMVSKDGKASKQIAVADSVVSDEQIIYIGEKDDNSENNVMLDQRLTGRGLRGELQVLGVTRFKGATARLKLLADSVQLRLRCPPNTADIALTPKGITVSGEGDGVLASDIAFGQKGLGYFSLKGDTGSGLACFLQMGDAVAQWVHRYSRKK